MNLKSNWKKVVLGAIATIILGAVGSGVWDIVGKQVSFWVGRVILGAITLGSVAVRDSIYREAAKGLHEAVALEQFFVIMLFAMSLGAGFAGYLDGRAAGEREGRAEAGRVKDATDGLSPYEVRQLLVKRRSELNAKLGTWKTRYRWAVRVTVLLVASFLCFNFLKLDTANRLYTGYATSIVICTPYIDSHQRDILNSRFAQVKTKGDYVNLMRDLQEVADKNHVQLPKLDDL